MKLKTLQKMQARPDSNPKPTLKSKFKKFKKPGKIEFHRIKTWKLIVVLIPLLFIDATLLRVNHIKMTELRDAVLEADQNEDDEAIERNLSALKEFTLSNIVINVVDDNGAQKVTFGTGPFYLEQTYRRTARVALEEAQKAAEDDSNPYGNIYQMASSVCQPQAIANGWTWDSPQFVGCMRGEIEKYPASENLADAYMATLPSTELYRKEYVSPVWAPSLIGFLLIITIILIVVIFIRGVIWVVLRLSLLFV